MERPLDPSTHIVGRTDSQSSYWRSSLYRRERRLCQYFLIALSVIIIIGMIIGLIFVAHYYFHIWGGQGFLRARKLEKRVQNCLPVRGPALSVQVHGFDYSELKRSPLTIPFNPCGDQQNSCAAYNQEDICCPMGMSCHSTPFSMSGTFCCNSTASDSECEASSSRPPQCPLSTVECAAVDGGGCCPNGTACSENGCIEFDGSGTPPPITSTYLTTIVRTIVSETIKLSSDSQGEETCSDSMLTTITTTITLVIGGATSPTATVYKQGTEAQKAEGMSVHKIGWPISHISYSLFWSSVFIALFMVLL